MSGGGAQKEARRTPAAILMGMWRMKSIGRDGWLAYCLPPAFWSSWRWVLTFIRKRAFPETIPGRGGGDRLAGSACRDHYRKRSWLTSAN